MTDLLEIYNRSFDTKDDKGIKGPPTPASYLGSNPGPMPPKPSPIKKEYLEIRENQPLDGTSIDGGSTNDPASGFIQTYSGENPFYTTKEGVVRATDGESPLADTLKVTALDVENEEAGVKQGGFGGPNRTSAANGEKSSFLEGGKYKVLRYPTKAKFIDTKGHEDAGTLETMTLQQYTPNRTYLEVLADPNLEIQEVVDSNNEQPTQGGVPTNIDESIVPDIDKPKLNDLKNFNI